MSYLQNSHSLFNPKNQTDKTQLIKEFITTPYEKVVSILNDIKKVLAINPKNQKYLTQLNWVIEIISSHSLYTYEILNQKEKVEKIQKEIPEFKHLIEFLSDPNEQFTQRNNQILKNTYISNKNNSDDLGIMTPSRNTKRKKQMTISFPKYPNEEDKAISSSFERQSSHFLTNRSNFTNNSNDNSNPLPSPKTPLTINSLREMADKGLLTSYIDNNDGVSPSDKLIFDEEDDSSSRSNDNFNSNNNTILPIHNELNVEAKDVLSFSFDIFSLKEKVGYSNVMLVVGKMIYDYFGFDDNILNANKLDSFLTSLSGRYYQHVPYHNAIHGADVTQTVAMFIINSNLEEKAFTNVNDIVSIITACLGHDVGHPGLNNNFHMNALTDIAITYNDISILENFHAATLFTILRKKENNIFDHYNDFDYKLLRKRIISQILATDMMQHGKVLGVIKGKISNGTEVVNKNSKNIFDEQEALFDFIVHAGDIAHNAKSFKISVKWVELLSNEFWNQGDKEKGLNIQVSFLCDRNDTDVPKSQVGFIKAFILPVFEVVTSIFPSLNVYLENANANLEIWNNLSKEGRKTGFTPEKRKSTRSNEDKSIQYNSNTSNSNNIGNIKKNKIVFG